MILLLILLITLTKQLLYTFIHFFVTILVYFSAKNLNRTEAVAGPSLRPSGRSSSVHEIKSRPRPSTFQNVETISKNVSGSTFKKPEAEITPRPRPMTFQNVETSIAKIGPPTRQLSVGSIKTTTNTTPIGDYLIKFNKFMQ